MRSHENRQDNYSTHLSFEYILIEFFCNYKKLIILTMMIYGGKNKKN